MKYFILSLVMAGMLPAAEIRVTPGINAFTTATYQSLAQGNGNLILSPFNIGISLSMALAGARGATADGIAKTLHERYDESYDSALSRLTADLAKMGNVNRNELLMANELWVQQGFPIQAKFEKTLADDYHAPLTPLDFIANPEGARREINRWAAQHTKDRIKEISGPNSLNRSSRLILTSAIYFYGKWERPFLTSRTQRAAFMLLSGGNTQTNFMNQTARFGYAETPSSQILEMRYTSTGMAFDVLLPKSRDGLSDLEKSLTSERLFGWLGTLAERKVQVTLPKFRAEAEFSLCGTLSAMGMRTAFTDGADFSGISSHGKLKISDVVHKAFVDVTEAGTEAAAVTGTHVTMIAARPPEEPIVFRADHPFLFLIRDTGSGAILFVGRLTIPNS